MTEKNVVTHQGAEALVDPRELRVPHPDRFQQMAKDAVLHHHNQLPSHGRRAYRDLMADDIYVVWFSKALQNWKAMISTDLLKGSYYEVTHNGNKNETYVDVYLKVGNTCIPDSDFKVAGE